MCTRSHIVPGLRTRARHVVRPVKGALTAERTLSGRVISGVVSRLIYVPLVLLIVVNADRGRVVGANRPALDLLEELLGVRLGIRLGGGDPREQREPLRRRRLHERRAAHLARQRLDRLDPRPPPRWRAGIQAVEALSREMSGTTFMESTPAQRLALLTRIAAAESDPKTDAEKFFKEIKGGTIRAYYTSTIGIHDDQQYKGNVYQTGDYAGYDAP